MTGSESHRHPEAYIEPRRSCSTSSASASSLTVQSNEGHVALRAVAVLHPDRGTVLREQPHGRCDVGVVPGLHEALGDLHVGQHMGRDEADRSDDPPGLPSQRPVGVLGRHGCDEQARSTHVDDPHLDPVSRRRPRKQSAAPDVPPREEEPRVAPIALAHREHYPIRRASAHGDGRRSGDEPGPGRRRDGAHEIRDRAADRLAQQVGAGLSATSFGKARPVEHRLRTLRSDDRLVERDPGEPFPARRRHPQRQRHVPDGEHLPADAGLPDQAGIRRRRRGHDGRRGRGDVGEVASSHSILGPGLLCSTREPHAHGDRQHERHDHEWHDDTVGSAQRSLDVRLRRGRIRRSRGSDGRRRGGARLGGRTLPGRTLPGAAPDGLPLY